MTHLAVLNRTRYSMLGNRVLLADSMFTRLRGFLFRPEPLPGEGLILSPCRAVHMFGVRFPLDLLFVSAEGVVVGMHKRLAPGERTAFHRDSEYAIELPAGVIAASRTEIGDTLVWHPAQMVAATETNGQEAPAEPALRPPGKLELKQEQA